MRDRWQRIRRPDDGMTLVELLVSMIVFSVLIGFVYGIMITVLKQQRDIEARDNTVFNARIALQQMDRQIRSGNVFYDPNNTADADYLPMSMRVYTQANGDQKCIQWQVLNGQLRSRAWSATWQTDGNVTAWSVVARGLKNTNTTADRPFSLPNTTQYGPRLLDVRLIVEDPRAPSGRQTLESSLSGRNTQYGFDSGICRPAPPA